MLVVGIPNVGKSSLINFLRNTALGKKGEPKDDPSLQLCACVGVSPSCLQFVYIRMCTHASRENSGVIMYAAGVRKQQMFFVFTVISLVVIVHVMNGCFSSLLRVFS